MGSNKKVLSKAVSELGKAKAPAKPRDITVDPKGYWNPANQGQPVRVPGQGDPKGVDITMHNVNQPIWAQPNVGPGAIMYPEDNRHFSGASYVDETPIGRKGGTLKSKKYSKSMSATNKLFTKNKLFQNKKSKIFDPNAEFKKGGTKLGTINLNPNPLSHYELNYGFNLSTEEDGGENEDKYMDLTDEEIQAYRDGGYIVEELPEHEIGGFVQHELVKAQKGKTKKPLEQPAPQFNLLMQDHKQQYIKKNSGSPELNKQDLVKKYQQELNKEKAIKLAKEKLAKEKAINDAIPRGPVSDNTRTVIPKQVVSDINNAAFYNSPQETANREARKKEQAAFEKEQWNKYNKMSFAEKALDRTQAAIAHPILMAGNALAGNQAYIPGMGRGLMNTESPEYDKYLKATGQTKGQFEISDLANIVNPGYWGAHAGNELHKGNYGTGLLEAGLAFAGVPGSGRTAVQGVKSLAQDVTQGTKYLGSKIDKTIYPTRTYRAHLPGGNETSYEVSELAKKINKKGDWTTKDLVEAQHYLKGTEALGGKRGLLTGDDMLLTEYKVPFWKRNVSYDKDVTALKKLQDQAVNSNEFIIPNNKFLYPRRTNLIKAVPEEVKTFEELLPNGNMANLYNPGSFPLGPNSTTHASKPYKYIEDQINAVTGHNMPLSYKFDGIIGNGKVNAPLVDWKQPRFAPNAGIGEFSGVSANSLKSGAKYLGKTLGTETGLLSNVDKYNSLAFKPNSEATKIFKAQETKLNKNLEPYLSKRIISPTKEEQVYESFLSNEAMGKKQAERTLMYDRNGNIINKSEIELPGSPNVASSVDDVGKGFKSEIDWVDWVKKYNKNYDSEDIQNIIKNSEEYNIIEQQTKANGAWMKNSDGSAYQGTPEQFVQQQSQNFKNAFGDNYVTGYHGSNKGNIQEFRKGKVGDLEDGVYLADSPKDADSYRLKLNPFSKKYELAARTENPLTFDAKNKLWTKLDHDELINKIGQENFNALEIKPKKKYDTAEVTDIAKKLGYDAVNFKNIKDAGMYAGFNGDILRGLRVPINKNNYSIINPKNIKSLLGNNGMFDMTNPNKYKNIYKALAPLMVGAGALQQEKNGGAIESWEDDLDDNEIEELRRGGFIVEELK